MLQNVHIYRMTLQCCYSSTIVSFSELIFFYILITSLCIPLISLCNLEHYNFLWTDFSQLFSVISKLDHLIALFFSEIKCRRENFLVWRYSLSCLRRPICHQYLYSLKSLPVLLLIRSPISVLQDILSELSIR